LTGFGEYLMRRSLSANAHVAELPPSDLCRAFGLAAVAAELDLEIDTLEPDTAEAVARGAATLFLAGYGPNGTRLRSRRQFRSESDRPKARRAARAGRSRESGASFSKTTLNG
jgi:hypothetical protein